MFASQGVITLAGADFSFRWRHVEAAKPGSGGACDDVAPAARWGASLTALTAGKARAPSA